MKIKSINPTGRYSNDEISKSIFGIIEKTKLCSVATISSTDEGLQSHISTAFYCYTNRFDFYILTSPNTIHAKNLEKNSTVALAIFDSHQVWDSPKEGLQMFGKMRLAPATSVPEAFATYIKEYPGLLRYLTHPSEIVDKLENRFFKIEIEKIRIFDEPSFGSEVWIDVDIEI